MVTEQSSLAFLQSVTWAARNWDNFTMKWGSEQGNAGSCKKSLNKKKKKPYHL